MVTVHCLVLIKCYAKGFQLSVFICVAVTVEPLFMVTSLVRSPHEFIFVAVTVEPWFMVTSLVRSPHEFMCCCYSGTLVYGHLTSKITS